MRNPVCSVVLAVTVHRLVMTLHKTNTLNLTSKRNSGRSFKTKKKTREEKRNTALEMTREWADPIINQ